MGDLNEVDYYQDLRKLINELEDNNNDEEDKEYPPSTMEERRIAGLLK